MVGAPCCLRSVSAGEEDLPVLDVELQRRIRDGHICLVADRHKLSATIGEREQETAIQAVIIMGVKASHARDNVVYLIGVAAGMDSDDPHCLSDAVATATTPAVV